VYLVREILPPLPSKRNEDVFEEDVFGLVQSPPFGVYSLAQRSVANRSTTTRRASLLKPIEERSFSSPSSPTSASTPYTYGREFAIKVLSKANLDADELAVQMTEGTIHQSLKVHPNIVTLHCSLETDALLLPVLEYVPGEDLYYFLEQEQQQKEKERIGDARTGDLEETE
jgi:serine/threonine protein kinase